jgi:hypothetical protein
MASRWAQRLPARLEKLTLIGLTACLVAAVPRAWVNLWPRPGQYDLKARYVEARAAAAGESPYSAAALDAAARAADCCAGVTSYVTNPYPPWVAGLFSPLARLKFDVVARIWFALNGALLVLSLWLVIRETSLRWSWPAVAVLGSLFPYADYTLRLGQITPLILASVLLGTRLLKRRSTSGDVLGGALVGFAGSLKIFPLLCVWPLAVHRRRAGVLGATLGFCLAAGAGLLVPGARASLGEWVNRIAPKVAVDATGTPQQQSIQATAIRLLTPVRVLSSRGDTVVSRPVLVAPRAATFLGRAVAGLVALLSLGAAVRRAGRQRGADLLPEIALMLATVTLVVPLAWDVYFLMLLPAEALLLAQWRDGATRRLLLAGAALLALHRFWRLFALAGTSALL